MKIGLDAKRIVRNATGLGHYGRTLVASLADFYADRAELRLYAPDAGREGVRPDAWPQNVSLVLPEKRLSGLGKALWRSHGIVSDLRRDGVGLFHGLSGELPWGIRSSGIRSVVTVHDLIFMRHPEYYNPLDVLLYRLKFRQTCREADRMIAISECTKRDIVALSHYPEDRIDVVYQGIADRFGQRPTDETMSAVRQRYRLPDRYVLFVGTIEQRKNAGLAVEALPQLPDDVALVLVGRRTKYADAIEKRSRELGVEARVHFLHGVKDDELACVYRMAEVFVYPSRYEGFGIPIVEALQSGLPVVAATGSCLEEAGGDACFYVAPDDARDMAAALQRLLSDAQLRANCVGRGRAYIRRFENVDLARQVDAVYRRVLDTPQ